MKRYIRETHEVLEGLGFTRQDDPFGRSDRATYTHHYEPESHIRVYGGATEAACKAIQARAHQIAGLGTSGAGLAKTVGERKKEQRKRQSKERAREQRAQVERRERARRAEAESRRVEALEKREKHEREIRSLMMPGRQR